MREVTSEESKKIQLDILIHVAKFCDEHEINYSLAYGTLIGAIRHKGFIPWDDDVDIIMKRVDYERFIQLYQDKNYAMIDGAHQANHLHIRISDVKTHLYFLKSETNNKYYKRGVWVDVFPIDKTPDEEWKYLALKKWNYYLYLLMKIGEVKGPNIVTRTLHPIIKPITPSLLRYVQRKIISYNSKKTHTVANLSLWYLKYPQFPAYYMDEYIYVEFEGLKFKALKHYHEFLTGIYGNYMQLPPEEDRKPRHGFIAYWNDENVK